ncbi:MAG TPA: hypothetical protein VEZ14_13855 [Dehalococcoidia bacterium]|nr:hypothetical protein [Dehalococcoidia bacterium]
MFETTKSRILAIAAGPAVVATLVGGSLLVGVTSAGAQTPPKTPTTPTTQSQTAPDTSVEAPETASATDPVGPNGTELPGGHDDGPGANVQHDFQGQE